MKKKYLILIALSLIPISASATSGACSYHNGVNCSAGADYNGKVQCNDGWVNSSVYYSDTDECKLNLNNICPLPYIYGATDISMCDQYQKNCNDTNKGIYNATLMSGGNPTLSQSCPEADQCRKDVALNTSAIRIFNQCLETFKQTQVDTAQIKKENADILLKQTIQKNLDLLCQRDNGENSYSKNGSCHCSDGYFFNKKSNICMLNNEANSDLYCKQQYGDFSVITPSDLNSCSCKEGYQFDSNKQCIATSVSSIVKLKPKSSAVAPIKIVNKSIKIITATTSSQIENVATSSVQKPVKKLTWYQKIFNWFVRK
jgi:hypothetical protein